MTRRPRRKHDHRIGSRVVAVVASLACFVGSVLSVPAAAKRGENLQDVPIAVTVIDSCDIEPELVSAADLLATTPLPSSVGGCMVSFPAGRAEDALTIRGITAIEDRRVPSIEILSVELNEIPGCYAAQQDRDSDSEKDSQEEGFFETEFNQRFRSRLEQTRSDARAELSEQAGVLVRPSERQTPEKLIEGTVTQWTQADATGPTYYLVAGGGFEIIVTDESATGAASTTVDGGTVTVPAGEMGDTVIVEEIDECTTQTTVVRKSGGSTITNPPGIREEPEDIHLTPGGGFPPSAPPEEEEDDEEGPLYCTIRDGEILTPVTREYLKPENSLEPPVSRHSPAMGGVGLQLGSGRWLRSETDLHVKSLGHDFVLERTYAGHMETEHGGNLGHRWQLNVDRRITVEAFTEERQGLKVEPLFGNARISYADGYGRVDSYQGMTKEVHEVQNFGVQPFSAHITTFASPPGAMHEIQRYIAVKRTGEMGLEADPTKHPFAKHPNVDVEHGEALFYVLRTPEHDQYVFNCRGQNIAVLDRFGHTTKLEYGGAINPLTHNPVLTQISDASDRRYVFEADHSVECAPFSTWFRGGVKTNACAPVPQFTEVVDPWARVIKYGYSPKSELATIQRKLGSYSGESGYTYVADGAAEHLVRTAWDPKGSRAKPMLVMSYSGGKASAQVHGGFAYSIRYPGKTTTQVTNPGGGAVRYELDKKISGTVVTEVARTAANQTLTTRFRHNMAGQVLRVTHPRGNSVRFTYYGKGQPVVIPTAPMQNLADLKITYRNSLSEGFLASITRVSHLPDDGVSEVTEKIAYEPLYNQVSQQTDARGGVTKYAYRYDVAGAYGRPLSVQLPDRTDADGDVLTNIVTTLAYDKDGHRVEETDMLGNATSYGFDGLGELASIRSPVGASQSFKRDERGNLLEEKRPSGLVLRYRVDLRDLPTQLIEDPSGARITSTYAYDENFNRTRASRQIKDLFSGISGVPAAADRMATETIVYNGLNRPVKETFSAGSVSRTIERTFNAAGREMTVKTSGMTVTHSYDGFNRLTKTQSGAVFNEVSYDANGNVEYEFDAQGNGASYGYDGLDRRILLVDPLDTHFHQRFDAADNLLERRAEGITGKLDGSRRTLQHIRFDIDEHNKTRRMSEASLNGGYGDVVTKFFYSELGHVVREQVGRDSFTSTLRDADGRATKVTDPEGNALEMTYSPDGLVTSLVEVEQERQWLPRSREFATEAKRYASAFEYDLFGHLIKKTQGMLTTRLCWDSANNLRCERNSRSGRKVIRYAGVDRPMSVSVDGAETRLAYNAQGMLTEIAAPSGTEKRSYDPAGRLTAVTGPGGTVRTGYDVIGNPISVTDGRGQTIENQFGPSGLLVSASTPGEIERFRHDGLGRVIFASTGPTQHITVEREFDGLGQLMSDAQSYNGDVQTVTSKSASDRSKTLSYPRASGGGDVRYRVDRLGRVTSIQGPEPLASAGYVYSGTGRLAGRYAGDHVSNHRYDSERRLIEKVLHDKTLGVPKRWEGSLSYERGRLASSRATYYPTSSTYGANKISRHEFSYDNAGRIAQTDTVISTRQYTTTPWLHQSQIKYNVYARDGSLRRVATSFASVAKEGFFSKEDIRRVSEVRVDAFSRNDTDQITNTATTVLKPNAQVDAGALGLTLREVDDVLDNAGTYKGFQDKTQPFRYDGNGNLIEDKQFEYVYDFRNRLIRVRDKMARLWRREQELFIRYDALGRTVAREYRLGRVSRAAFDRKDTRLIYWQRQTIAELARSPAAGPTSAWRSLARYIPGASAGETLLMQRREDDDLTAGFKTYFLYEGLRGDMAFVAEPVGRLERVLRTPHFTGEDAWVQGTREEPFIAGTTTRMPITGKGQRYDSFTRMTTFDGRPGAVADYQAAPFLEYERYSVENYAALLDRVQKHHPKPEFLRNLEYGATGAMLLVMAPMLPVAAEGLLLMELEGMIAVGVDVGLSAATGNKVTARGLAESFAMGAVSGGVGRIAGGMSAMAGMSRAGQIATGISVDITVGTALDVGVSGGSFSKALVSNVLSAGISTGLGAGLNVAKRLLPEQPARAPSHVTPESSGTSNAFVDSGIPVRQNTMPGAAVAADAQLIDAITHIAKLAAKGMPAAQQFLRDFKANKFLLAPPSNAAHTLDDRLTGYRQASNYTGKTVISVDHGLDAQGYHHKGGTTAANSNQVIQLQAGMTPKFTAVTLLHEFSHARGANELQAFHITYDAMNRLRMLSSPHPGVSVQTQTRARSYLNSLNSAHGSAGKRRVAGLLRMQILGDYMPRFWTNGAEALRKTNPDAWVSELGARPW